jgi:hypothetical protein
LGLTPFDASSNIILSARVITGYASKIRSAGVTNGKRPFISRILRLTPLDAHVEIRFGALEIATESSVLGARGVPDRELPFIPWILVFAPLNALFKIFSGTFEIAAKLTVTSPSEIGVSEHLLDARVLGLPPVHRVVDVNCGRRNLAKLLVAKSELIVEACQNLRARRPGVIVLGEQLRMLDHRLGVNEGVDPIP